MNSRDAVVNLQPGTSIPVVRVSQYDVGVTLNFVVFDGNEPASFDSGTTVTIQATRPSGTGFVQNCMRAGNVVTVNTVIAMTQEYGRMQAELRFVNGSIDVGTGNFVYIVEKAAHADDTIDADVNQWTGLAQQIHADTMQSTQNANIANNARTEAEGSADTATKNADIAVKAAKSAGQASDTAVSAKEAAEAAANTATTTVANTVRFDILQTKTDEQKLQARNNVGSAGATSLAPDYSASSTYAVGDVVTQNGKLYKCSTAIETAEAWTAGHWVEVAVSNEITNLKVAVGNEITHLKDELSDIGTSAEIYLPLTVLPNTANAITTYPINLNSDNKFPVKLIITNGSSDPGYFGYGLYQGDNLVWGIGVPESGTKYIASESTITFDVDSGIIADSLKIRNRNGRANVTISLFSEFLSNTKNVVSDFSNTKTDISNILYSLINEYDETSLYDCGSYTRVNGIIYRCVIAVETPETFTSWRWEKVAIVDDIISPIKKTIFTDEVPWIGGETISFNNGKIVSTTANRKRTNLIKNVEEIIGGNFNFNVFVYRNGTYIGMLHEDGSVSIPSSSVIQLKYAYLGNFDESYSFALTQYNDGNTSQSKNPHVEIRLKKFAPYNLKNVFVIDKSGNYFEGYTDNNLFRGICYCYNNEISKIIVKPGTYNLINEMQEIYGDEWETNITEDSLLTKGIPLSNMDIVFQTGAKVECNYTGSNADFITYFSPFDLSSGTDVTVTGLHLECGNVRYGIHDDVSGKTSACIHTFKECYVRKTDNNSVWEQPYCLAGGLGSHSKHILIDCDFACDNNTSGNYNCLYYHNNAQHTGADGYIRIENMYCSGRFGSVLSGGQVQTDGIPAVMYVHGCRFTKGPTQGNAEAIIMKAWGNIIESD